MLFTNVRKERFESEIPNPCVSIESMPFPKTGPPAYTYINAPISTTMRIALKVGYIGTNYHGFQIQPDVLTIEGELFASLKKLDLIKNPHEANYIASGRTDKGVHALGQVIAFDTPVPEIAIPRAINSNLPGTIWTWARAQVPDGFDPRRHAKSREYMYIMPGKLDNPLLNSASKLIMGEHDFLNFITPEKDRISSTFVYKLNTSTVGEFTIMDISADHFLWHMVRKIATALKMIGSGKRDIPWLEKMLLPSQFREALPPAPAHGLVLKNVEYGNIDWKEDPYAKKKTSEILTEEFLWHSVMAQMLNELKKDMTPDN
ncbi:tRNA pseudouridine synthase A [Methanosarcinales archaeon]|nr:tRNA pseudouridine synthase A [Methanosarcinales archaeon]